METVFKRSKLRCPVYIESGTFLTFDDILRRYLSFEWVSVFFNTFSGLGCGRAEEEQQMVRDRGSRTREASWE